MEFSVRALVRFTDALDRLDDIETGDCVYVNGAGVSYKTQDCLIFAADCVDGEILILEEGYERRELRVACLILDYYYHFLFLLVIFNLVNFIAQNHLCLPPSGVILKKEASR